MATSTALRVGTDLGTVEGMIKSWVPRKGFGFVSPDEGQPTGKEIFLHATQVKAFNPQVPRDGPQPGSKITCRVEMGEKGLVVSEVLALEAPSAESSGLPPTPLFGEVKWFEPEAKGFGFIKPEGDGKEIFFHVKVVEASGIEPHLLMLPGVRVKITEVGFSRNKPKPEVKRLELVAVL